ncbi:Fic family protein [Hydrogenophaga soli]
MAQPEPDRILALLSQAGPAGLAPADLTAALAPASRSTVNRRLAGLAAQGLIGVKGQGRATRYVQTERWTREQVDAFFAQPWQSRPVARFDEALLHTEPGLPLDKAMRLTHLQARVPPMDAAFLASFVVDFSWGSSVLEGSTYSMLDTEALLAYGQRHPDKPAAEAVLALNHRQAAEHQWQHRALTVDNVCAWHALLTSDHGLPDVAESDHFLPEHQRGRPREYEEVNLGASAYLPPFRPGTRYVAGALATLVERANGLHPLQAALYLMTRIPYLQAFANGNKRTSRIAANALLLSHGLAPLSFADMDKASYIRGMAAFYELGSTDLMEQVLVRGCVQSVVRSSVLPLSLRGPGFDVPRTVELLSAYVHTGKRPTDRHAAAFF